MRKLFLILMTLCAVTWSAMAQTRHISGTVVDAANNEPLIGATVMPIGGGQGAATDVDGNFSLNIPDGVKSVKVSYVGYKEQTVPVSSQMVVRLASSSTNLDDVVVVAYGTANKESLTGSVAVVGAKEIEDRPVTSVTSALEGSAPGVNVNSSSGYPGSAPSIRIRGYNSFNSSAMSPLYVVDGIVYNGDIADINPADVESMSVLKDAASCALYGSRGANGVVLITTKKAKGQGKVDVNVQMNWGAYGLALPLYDRLGVKDWMQASLRGLANGDVYNSNGTMTYEDAAAARATTFVNDYLKGGNIFGHQDENGNWVPVESYEVFNEQGLMNPGVRALPGYNDLNWWDAITRTGTRQEYNINAAGATDKFDAFASVGYLKQDGYVLNTDFERFTGRFNANYNPVSYFRAGMNLAGSYSSGSVANASNQGAVTNPFLTMFYAPVRPIYAHNEDGSIVLDDLGHKVYAVTGGLNDGGNLIQGTKLNKISNKTLSLDASIYGTAILPYGFEATVRGSMFRSKQDYNDYSNNKEGSQKDVGGLDRDYMSVFNYSFSQSLNWSHEYGANHVDVLLHHENYKVETDESYFRLSGQKLDNRYDLSNFDEITNFIEQILGYNTESYLGRVRYNYDQKYFAEFSLNRDGTSQFHKDHRWGTFWSVGASWIISKEKFMHNLNWLNYLKLRAAYGTTGNNQACSYYNYLTLFTFGSTGVLQLDQLAAPDLKWESTNTLDLALEGSLFNDRFNFSIGFFDKRNADLIYSLTKPFSGGTTNNNGSLPSILTNIGEMQNYGWELQFGVDIIRNQNVTWDFNIDASFITNKIKKLPNGRDLPSQGYFIGKSRYEKYTYEWAGVDQLTGRSLYYMNPNSPDFYSYNENGKKEYNEALWNQKVTAAKNANAYVEIDGVPYTYDTVHAGRKLMGSALPVVFGSFGSNVSWKGLRFGLLFTYSLGGKVMDNNYNSLMSFSKQGASALHKDVLKGWKQAPEGMTADSPNRIDKNGIPQINGENGSYSTQESSQYLIGADYLSLKNLSLSYDLPRKWVNALKLQNINVGFQMENVFIATRRKGLNSMSSAGGTVGSTGAYYQPARTYTFQLGVRF